MMMALDISASMLSRDLQPNRLEALKEVAQDFVSARTMDRLGLVIYAGEAYSPVPLTTDHTLLNGQIQGQPGGELIMQFISQGESFSIGEIALTSGLGSNFPKGIAVGQVVEIIQQDFEETQQAIIRSTVNFSQLESVLIITNFDPLEFVPDLELPSPEGVPEEE